MDEFIPKIYDCVKEQLQTDLMNLNCEMSLSIEDWESSSGDIYSTVSLHYAMVINPSDPFFKNSFMKVFK